MKHLWNILLSVLLSMTLVYMGAGVIIFKCCKEIISHDAPSGFCCEKECCYGVKNSCSALTVIKLPSAVKVKQAKSLLPDIAVCDYLYDTNSFSCQAANLIKPETCRLLRMYHAPPRDYLTFIRVLII